jgi:Family of unknown function (DUF5670)
LQFVECRIVERSRFVTLAAVIAVEPRFSSWHGACSFVRLEGANMLWTIAVILGVMWLLGMVSSTTFGGFLHLLLVLAIAAVLISLIQGRRVV